MTGGSRIVAIDGGSPDTGDAEFLLTEELALPAPADEASPPEAAWDETPQSRRSGWVAPALALLAIIAWTALFVWSRLAELLARPTPAQWTAHVADWAVPTLLVCVIWLLALRTSRREAARFGDAARVLANESASLETRLTTVNRELSLAREFLAAQSRDLEAMGRIAVDRLSHNADRLQQLVVDNSAQIDAIGDVSLVALENMDKLRGQLPVIASSAKDVTNHIANAGRTAHGQIQDLIEGFMRINEFGQASERQVDILSARIEKALGEYVHQCDQLDRIAGARFDEMAQISQSVRADLDAHEHEALAAIKARASALAAEFAELRGQVEGDEEAALTSLRARLGSLRDESAVLSRALRDAETRALAEWSRAVARADSEMRTAFAALDTDAAQRNASTEAHVAAIIARNAEIGGQLAAFDDQLAKISAEIAVIDASIGTNLGDIVARLATGQEAITGTEQMMGRLTDSSVRLLELIQASARHSREELPKALAQGEERLQAFTGQVDALRDGMAEIHGRGEDVSARFAATADAARALGREIETAAARLGPATEAHGKALRELGERLEALAARNDQLCERARGELSTAISQLNGARETALAGLIETGKSSVGEIARLLESESSAAVTAAVRAAVGSASTELEAAASQAATVGRQATMQLRDQLAMVNELTGNLERRVAHARERAEEQVDNEFSRRAALITESLNSNAIDIAKALSADVADTSWAAYLRGDRGIFTRRAVTLLESAEARSVVQLYESDGAFREHVSRYIHDFEAILRQVLSTRDGNALGVALLSSDMGKLYVALAQAIERLRG